MEDIIKEKRNSKDLTVGSPIMAILLFALPLLFGNIFQQFYSVVDSLIVGNFCGDNALTAVSSSGPLINLLIGLIQGITVGAGILIAQHFGAKNYDRLSKAVHTTVAFCFVLGIGLTIIGVAFTPTLLLWMNTDPEVIGEASAYFRVYFMGSIFTVMYNAGAAIYRAVGDSKHPLYYLIIASFVNLVFDFLFVAIFKWGVIGAAAATVLAQLVSCIFVYTKLIREKTVYQLRIKDIKFDKQELLMVLRYGVPSGLQNSIVSLSNVFILSNINSFGKIASESYGVYSKIEGFSTLPSGSFSMALSTYVGQNIGAKKYKRVRKGAVQGLILSMAVTEFLALILFIFAPSFFRMFTKTPEIIALGTQQMRQVSLFYALLAFAHGMAGVLRGAGYSKTATTVLLVCWVAIRIIFIPVALSIPSLNKVTTIYWFYPLTWSLSFIVFTILALAIASYKTKQRKKNGEEEENNELAISAE
ncbi:MAG: MATE family efflux transporter [Bacilli bacterium]|nr:MATE family efflux transporter [Bacilli bacterium]